MSIQAIIKLTRRETPAVEVVEMKKYFLNSTWACIVSRRKRYGIILLRYGKNESVKKNFKLKP